MNKHEPIANFLRGEINTGKYSTDRRLPSEEALCRHWNVSRPTVARALRNLQLEGLIERRVGSGTFVNDKVRPLHTMIGMLVNGLGETEIWDPICAEISKAAQQRNCSTLTGGLLKDSSPSALATQWAAGGVRGVVFVPLDSRMGNAEERQKFNLGVLRSFRKAEIPVVLVVRDIIDFPGRSDLDLIEMDNFFAGYDLGKHLAAVGAQKIFFFTRPDHPSSIDLRLAGLSEASRRSELPPPECLIGEPEDTTLVRRLKSNDGTCSACVCSNDLTAAKLLKTLQDSGVHVPRDLLLAGFDDVSFATLLPVPLTTIRQPCRAIGIACVETLHGRMTHPGLPPRTILIRGELVVRKSTTRESS